MDSTVEGCEAVIGDDQERSIGSGLVDRLADCLIHLAIDLEQIAFVAAPEHMRILIDAGEVIKKEAALKPVEFETEQPQAVGQHFAALRKELRLGEDTRSEG